MCLNSFCPHGLLIFLCKKESPNSVTDVTCLMLFIIFFNTLKVSHLSFLLLATLFIFVNAIGSVIIKFADSFFPDDNRIYLIFHAGPFRRCSGPGDCAVVGSVY